VNNEQRTKLTQLLVMAKEAAVGESASPESDWLPDRVSRPRAVASQDGTLPGERLPGSDGDMTRDVLVVKGPPILTPERASGSRLTFPHDFRP